MSFSRNSADTQYGSVTSAWYLYLASVSLPQSESDIGWPQIRITLVVADGILAVCVFPSRTHAPNTRLFVRSLFSPLAVFSASCQATFTTNAD